MFTQNLSTWKCSKSPVQLTFKVSVMVLRASILHSFKISRLYRKVVLTKKKFKKKLKTQTDDTSGSQIIAMYRNILMPIKIRKIVSPRIKMNSKQEESTDKM